MNTEQEVLRAYLEANKRVQATQTDGQIMPLAILNTFLGAALWGEDTETRGEPATLEALASRLDISPTTLSTHLRYLGDKYRADKEGLNLVAVETYDLNRRMKTFRLTKKGRKLASALAYTLLGVQQDEHRTKR
ncbi:hypothetical protein [Mesorhizobium sp. M0767]|uniref:hypothetical protein n=1 Tax=Mesorhizobium sp. M0767 TaxID=2956995 RepID=UPI0033363449